jgi:hypothetical protein
LGLHLYFVIFFNVLVLALYYFLPPVVSHVYSIENEGTGRVEPVAELNENNGTWLHLKTEAQEVPVAYSLQGIL